MGWFGKKENKKVTDLNTYNELALKAKEKQCSQKDIELGKQFMKDHEKEFSVMVDKCKKITEEFEELNNRYNYFGKDYNEKIERVISNKERVKTKMKKYLANNLDAYTKEKQLSSVKQAIDSYEFFFTDYKKFITMKGVEKTDTTEHYGINDIDNLF